MKRKLARGILVLLFLVGLGLAWRYFSGGVGGSEGRYHRNSGNHGIAPASRGPEAGRVGLGNGASRRSENELSKDDLARIAVAVDVFRRRLKEIEGSAADIFSDYDYDGRQFLEVVLRGPTTEVLGEEFRRAFAGCQFDKENQIRGLKLALQEASDEFRTPEGAVGRILLANLPLDGKTHNVRYSLIGLRDWSHLRRNNAGRLMMPPQIVPMAGGGVERLDSEWRFSHIVGTAADGK